MEPTSREQSAAEGFSGSVEFARFLARRHGARGAVLEAVDRLVDYVLQHRRLPRRLRVGSRYLSPARLAGEALVRVKGGRR